ncbi:hypothetical protein AGMMS49982_08930 [Bacteroidia bacterium]|nr:hypothetical protein AGMMS49982_08930 [Bacteroidia bacterium]
MKKLKNVFLLAAMAVSAVCITSCGDDDKDNTPETEENGGNNNGENNNGGTTTPGIVFDGNKLTVTLSSGPANTAVDAVKLTAYDANSDKVTVAEGVYKDKVFTLTFGAVPDGCLKRNAFIHGSDEDRSSYTGATGNVLSDKTVKSLPFGSVDAYKGETAAGRFDFEYTGATSNRLEIIYVDKAAVLNGTLTKFLNNPTATYTFTNIALKQGWNVFYGKNIGENIYTATTSSAGLELVYKK